jgi:hypothetical protein
VRALKALVVGLGLLIVLAGGLLVYGLVQRASDPDFKFFRREATSAALIPATPPMPAPASPIPLRPFGTAMVEIPAGCKLVEVIPAGDRMLLRVGSGEAVSGEHCQRVVVIDLINGRVLGTVAVKSAP